MWERGGQGGLNSEVLRDMPLIMLNDRGRLLLVGAHDRTQVFGSSWPESWGNRPGHRTAP